MTSLSLYQIETSLSDLMNLYQEMREANEDTAAVEQQIAEYAAREVAKVDGVRQYLRHCEMQEQAAREEAERLAEYARSWKSRRDALKARVLQVMQVNGLKRIEGKTGVLMVKGNGGKVPLRVDETKVPAEFFDQRPVLNTDRVRAALEAGEGVPGAYLDQRGVHLECK